MSRLLQLSWALFLAGSVLHSAVALADEKPQLDSRQKAMAATVIKRWREARECCYREDIPAELSSALRQDKVKAHTKPLAAGETAPRLEGLPAGRPLAVLFYRGHW